MRTAKEKEYTTVFPEKYKGYSSLEWIGIF